jgi:hypothetical protein
LFFYGTGKDTQRFLVVHCGVSLLHFSHPFLVKGQKKGKRIDDNIKTKTICQ